MAAIKLFNMYAIDTPCDSISLETLNQSTSILIYDVIQLKRTDAIDFGPSVENKMVTIELLKYML